MGTPRAFLDREPASLDALLDTHPFVTLITVRDGVPDASHVPVLARREAGTLVLEGHWGRANPQAHEGDDVLVLVQGPHAYLSASWYPDKRERARVPTWNYVVAHLRGRFERFEDEDALGDLVARIAGRFEAEVGGDWRYDHADPRERAQLRGIVGFRVRVHAAELTRKLSQNHPVANRVAVIEALQNRPDDNARAIAALMVEDLSSHTEAEP